MVVLRKLLVVALLYLPLGLSAQRFSVDDTVTEYPHKGTFYHDKFEGRKTANGEIFDQNLFTAAHWKIEMGTYVMVTNKNTGLQVIVRVNDRCPKRGVFDLSHRAANSIGIRGCQPVTVRILPPTDEYIARWEAQDSRFDSVYSKFGGPAPQPKPQPEKKKEQKEKKEQKAPETEADPASEAPVVPQHPPAPQATTAPKIPLITDPPHTASSAQRYNLELCVVSSHGAAFDQIQKLPQHYREVAIVDSADLSYILVTLEVKLTKKSANELIRSLKKSFPDCKMVAVE